MMRLWNPESASASAARRTAGWSTTEPSSEWSGMEVRSRTGSSSIFILWIFCDARSTAERVRVNGLRWNLGFWNSSSGRICRLSATRTSCRSTNTSTSTIEDHDFLVTIFILECWAGFRCQGILGLGLLEVLDAILVLFVFIDD
jgi:hypothetical protein